MERISSQSFDTAIASPVIGLRRLMPALLTKIEILPLVAMSVATALQAWRSVTSSFMADAVPPVAAIRLTVSCAASMLTSRIITGRLPGISFAYALSNTRSAACHGCPMCPSRSPAMVLPQYLLCLSRESTRTPASTRQNALGDSASSRWRLRCSVAHLTSAVSRYQRRGIAIFPKRPSTSKENSDAHIALVGIYNAFRRWFYEEPDVSPSSGDGCAAGSRRCLRLGCASVAFVGLLIDSSSSRVA